MRYLILTISLILLAIVNVAAHPQTPRQLLLTAPSELEQKGDAFIKRNVPDSALKYFVALSAIYTSSLPAEDRRRCATAAIKAGEIYYSQSAYVAAFDSFMRGVRIAEPDSLRDIMALAYKNIGNINASLNDNIQAIDCYRRGLEYAASVGDSLTEFKINTNLTAIYAYENRIEEAKRHFGDMRALHNTLPTTPYLVHFTSGLISAAERNFRKALSEYDSALDIAMKDSLPPAYICAVYSERAKSYRDIEDIPNAIKCYQECASYADSLQIFNMLTESLLNLSHLYASEGQSELSRKYNMQYLAIKDSLITAEDYNRMKSEQFVYEMERNYNDILNLRNEIELREVRLSYQRNVIRIIIAALLVIMTMGGILWWQKRNLQSAYNVIFARNEELLKVESDYRIRKYDMLHEGSGITNDEDISEVPKKVHSVDRLPEETRKSLAGKITHIMENDKSIFNPEFSIDTLAHLTATNTRYLSSVINEYWSLNFRGLLTVYRIKEAQRRITDIERYGDLTLQAIALGVGYKSYANFVDLFKRQTGLTPSIYQKNARASFRNGNSDS